MITLRSDQKQGSDSAVRVTAVAEKSTTTMERG